MVLVELQSRLVDSDRRIETTSSRQSGLYEQNLNLGGSEFSVAKKVYSAPHSSPTATGIFLPPARQGRYIKAQSAAAGWVSFLTNCESRQGRHSSARVSTRANRTPPGAPAPAFLPHLPLCLCASVVNCTLLNPRSSAQSAFAFLRVLRLRGELIFPKRERPVIFRK